MRDLGKKSHWQFDNIMRLTTRAVKRFLSANEEKELSIHAGRDPSFIGLLIVVTLCGAIIFRTLLRRFPVPCKLRLKIFALIR